MVRLMFLKKKFIIQSEISTYSLIIAYSIFKNIEILLDEGVVQIRPNSCGVSPEQPELLECKTKRSFAIACLGKKLVFHTKIC